MTTRDYIPICLFVYLLVTFTGCGLLDSDGSEPIIPGPTNYEWKVETNPYYFRDIWGSSPNDIWGVAGGLHHYDGDSWSTYENSKVYSAETIHGFSHDDVWVGGNDGKIYHYDGESWELNYQFKNQGEGSSRITDIWGNSSENLYAVGTLHMPDENKTHSFLLKYDGQRWNIWNELLTTDYEVQFQRIRLKNGTPFIRAVKPGTSTSPDTLMIYQYLNETLQVYASKTRDQTNRLWLNNIGNTIGLIIDDQLIVLDNNQFRPLLSLHDFDTQAVIYGRHEKDLFISTWDQVFHYNGEEKTLLLDDLPRIVYRAQIFPEDVFFFISNYSDSNTLIYHGTLTDNE